MSMELPVAQSTVSNEYTSNAYSSNNDKNNKIHLRTGNKIKKCTADEFISSMNANDEKIYNKDFHMVNTPSVMILSLLAFVGYTAKTAIQTILKKKPSHTIKKGLIKTGIAFCVYSGLNVLAPYIENKNKNKNLAKTQKLFDSLNGTHSKLSDKVVLTPTTFGDTNLATGEVRLNPSLICDPFGRLKSKYTIKHELVHARQFEMIARSTDGIKKLNFDYAKMIYNLSKDDKEWLDNIDSVYQELSNDKTDKYKDTKVLVDGTRINFKDFITAMYTIIHKDGASYNDIPMLIDTKHWEEVRKNSPALTEEEEIKANEYYMDELNFDPTDDENYRANIMEQEAFKENPWWTRII